MSILGKHSIILAPSHKTIIKNTSSSFFNLKKKKKTTNFSSGKHPPHVNNFLGLICSLPLLGRLTQA